MRIVSIRETTANMRSDIRNAVIDFSQMTASVVAVITDVERDGKPVVGYGFSSNGRYAAGGILRERLIPPSSTPTLRRFSTSMTCSTRTASGT